MRAYWAAMRDELARCSPGVLGQDQGAHMYLLRHVVPSLPVKVYIEPVETGAIATLNILLRKHAIGVCSRTRNHTCYDGATGMYTNHIGRRPLVMHQYNRGRHLFGLISTIAARLDALSRMDATAVEQ